MSVEQRWRGPRDATAYWHRRDTLHLSEIRTYLQVRDMVINFRWRRERLVAHPVRHREPREHVPVVARVAEVAPISEIRAGVAELDLRICRVAQQEVGKIISDAGHGRVGRTAISGGRHRAACRR